MRRADAAVSIQWELSFGLKPMLQREAVSPALRFIELIRPLGNPDVPVNRPPRARHLGEQERDDRLRCFVRRVVAVQASWSPLWMGGD